MKNVIQPLIPSERRRAFPPPDPADIATPVPASIHLRNILIPTDLTEMSLKSLQYAVPLARQFGGKITLLHVIEAPAYTPELPFPAALSHDQISAIEYRLREIAADRIDFDIPVDLAVRHGFAFENILDVARENNVDLIITTTHGYSGLKHALMGSIAESVARSAPCPVLVVRETEHEFV